MIDYRFIAVKDLDGDIHHINLAHVIEFYREGNVDRHIVRIGGFYKDIRETILFIDRESYTSLVYKFSMA